MPDTSARITKLLNTLCEVYGTLRRTNRQLADEGLREALVANQGMLVQLNALATSCRIGIDEIADEVEQEHLKGVFKTVSAVLAITKIELNRLRHALFQMNRCHMRSRVIACQ